MQKTYEAKVNLDSAGEALLTAFARQYGSLKRKLYAWVAAKGGKAKDHKVEFCEKHLITARQFNALAVELQGLIDGVRELLKERVGTLERAVRLNKGRLYRAEALEKDSVKKAKRFQRNPKKEEAFNKSLKELPLKIERLKKESEEVRQRLKANVPGVCFGTRKLFNAQWHLEENGYGSFEEWKEDWEAARSNQFFILGSKDETAGNQSCKATIINVDATLVRENRALKELAGEATDVQNTMRGLLQKLQTEKAAVELELVLRRWDIPSPQALKKKGLPVPKLKMSERYLVVRVKFSYGREEILAALAKGQAISYRFYRNNETGQWYVYLSTEVEEAPKTSRDKREGMLGVDFNAGHLAVTETNAHGNLVKSWNVPFAVEGKTTEQREDALSVALQSVVDYAKRNRLGIAIEKLDFSEKKERMEKKSKRYRVMLSGLLYAKYQKLMEAKCHREGVVLHYVDPSFTSVIGRVKYALRHGISVHLSAAGAIARRAQGLSERIPSMARIAVGDHVETIRVPVRKARTKSEAWKEYGSEVRESLFKDWRERRYRGSDPRSGG